VGGNRGARAEPDSAVDPFGQEAVRQPVFLLQAGQIAADHDRLDGERRRRVFVGVFEQVVERAGQLQLLHAAVQAAQVFVVEDAATDGRRADGGIDVVTAIEALHVFAECRRRLTCRLHDGPVVDETAKDDRLRPGDDVGAEVFTCNRIGFRYRLHLAQGRLCMPGV